LKHDEESKSVSVSEEPDQLSEIMEEDDEEGESSEVLDKSLKPREMEQGSLQDLSIVNVSQMQRSF